MKNIIISILLIALGVIIFLGERKDQAKNINESGWKIHNYIGAGVAFVAGIALLLSEIFQ